MARLIQSLPSAWLNPRSVRRALEQPAGPRFSITNPNKVRALIAVFAMANPTAFHNKDGSGYEFLTDKIIELNAINPQVASRLVKPLVDWKKYDANRQEKMKQCLQKIKAVPDLSRDVFEIVDRSLNG